MSAPPLFRLVDERRVSVVRDAAAVRQVLDEDPVGCCMVASRVAEHGVDPSAIGGELWTRRRADRIAVLRRRQPDPAARRAPATYTRSPTRRSAPRGDARRWSGRAELVLPMWRRLEHAWGPARDVREHQPLMALATAPHARSTRRCGRCASTNSTPIWSPPSTCSSARSASTRASATAAAATGGGSPA